MADRNQHGRVVEFDGLRIAGLGGVFREKIWHPATAINDVAFDSPEKLLQHINARGGPVRMHSGALESA
jgi:hypothetical protein